MEFVQGVKVKIIKNKVKVIEILFKINDKKGIESLGFKPLDCA